MVHGVRKMRGVTATATPVDKGYKNEEEYITVVLSNIYLAEKGKTTLRGSHSDFDPLPQPRDFLTNPQRTSISPKQLLQSFKTAQPDFYDALEKIPEHKAWRNPIRELGDAADN